MSDAPIREFIEEWHRATIAEDIERLGNLMAEDVVFLAAGQPPMQGRDAFAKAFGKGTGYGIGLAFLGFIFFPMLGFSDATYTGAPAA